MSDAIDLRSVEYHNSHSPADWPITSTLTDVSWSGGKIRVVHTKTGQWPPIPFETAQQEATLWLFRYYDGRWHGAGAERFRPNQTEKDLGSPFDMGPGWLYDTNRWGSMANRPIAPGEVVGLMMTSGDMRSQMISGPIDPVLGVRFRERTNVALFQVVSNGIYRHDTVAVIPPAPVPPAPVPPGAPNGGSVDLTPVLSMLQGLEASQLAMGGMLDRIADSLERIEAAQQEARSRPYVGTGSIGPFRGSLTLTPRN